MSPARTRRPHVEGLPHLSPALSAPRGGEGEKGGATRVTLHPAGRQARPRVASPRAQARRRANVTQDPSGRSGLGRQAVGRALCRRLHRDRGPCGSARCGLPDTTQASRGKTGRLRRTPAGSAAPALDGRGRRDRLSARPAKSASYPPLVRRIAALLHASFGPRRAATPLRFAHPSPPSGWMEDLHPKALDRCVAHKKGAARRPPPCNVQSPNED